MIEIWIATVATITSLGGLVGFIWNKIDKKIDRLEDNIKNLEVDIKNDIKTIQQDIKQINEKVSCFNFIYKVFKFQAVPINSLQSETPINGYNQEIEAANLKRGEN